LLKEITKNKLSMSKVLSGIYLLFISLVAGAQAHFTIKGHLSGVQSGMVLLTMYDLKTVVDSSALNNGYFTFHGKQKLPVKLRLFIKKVKGKGEDEHAGPGQGSTDSQIFYLGKGLTRVNGDSMHTATIKNGKTQEEYRMLMSVMQPIHDKQEQDMKDFNRDHKDEFIRSRSDTSLQRIMLHEYYAMLEPTERQMGEEELKFVAEHPKSYVSLDIVGMRGAVIDPVTFPPLFNQLDRSLRNTENGKSLAARLEIAKKTAVGQPIIDFTQNDTLGNPVSLSSLRGKYVLIEFWASWCGPCRAENPNVVKTYQQFKDKNFQVISISLDDKKEAWLKAINKDGMPWIHVSDLQGWKNAVAVQYGVRAVPQNFLIDPKGVIIATNLRGEDLPKELQKLIAD
jgi:peroxiredoxin